MARGGPDAGVVLVPRFGPTERALHWLHASTFFAMLASGVVLFLPGAQGLASRPVAKAAHLASALVWIVGLVLVATLGDHRALRRTRRDLERFDLDDAAWLRGRKVPQGRFNAGQKVHGVLQATLSALFVISGTLLWLGERDTAVRLPGTIALHDVATAVAVVLVGGHLVLALVWPSTRPALRGIVRGTVDAAWAAAHHARWRHRPREGAPHRRPSATACALAAASLVLGAAGLAYVVADAADGGAPARAAAVAPASGLPAAPPRAPSSGLGLAAEARALDQSGRLGESLRLYARAVDALPRRGDVRLAYGLALARAGELSAAIAQLGSAASARPATPDARLYLGAALEAAGRSRRSTVELRRYLRSGPDPAQAALARRLLRQATRARR